MSVERTNQFEWNQFCKLGEMMGDGLHHESDGKWISKEYRRLSKILIPEIRIQDAVRRKAKNKLVDEKMASLLSNKKCDCGGGLKQTRSGSLSCRCTVCPLRFKARTKK